MGFIFAMSTDLGSAAHTAWFLVPLLKWLNPAISNEAIALIHTLVRKAAHLTEYAILALLVLRAAARSRGTVHDNFYRAASVALLVSATYAALDEFHQSFVPGRTASAYDVLIDTSGATAALVAAMIARKLRHPPTVAVNV